MNEKKYSVTEFAEEITWALNESEYCEISSKPALRWILSIWDEDDTFTREGIQFWIQNLRNQEWSPIWENRRKGE
jgi:hypothetical protein